MIHTTRDTERSLGQWMRARLPYGVAEFVMFVLKQGWAALFGGLMLIGIMLSKAIWQPDWALARYDALVIYAVVLQAGFLWLKLESWAEARVILLFHLTGTIMEIFKIQMGSWAYPEPGLLKFMGVPLFSGFMYASVGSYMARVIRIFDMRFTPFPPLWAHFALAAAIYLNFFTHHWIWDMRWVLMGLTVILFIRTRIWFRIGRFYWMPLPLAAFFSSFFLWIAENVGTRSGTWVYAGTKAIDWASLAKMGSWYLLLYVSFATVTLVYRQALGGARPIETPASAEATDTDPRPEAG
ncbi:DUF817 domain-containing protein [Aliiroseovarius crassostreae]|uniref:DUF817 domain-containing protein n=1 Tax=Aliiroseovarius crassostreae TaxID=154981 RepID=UPI003C79AA4A